MCELFALSSRQPATVNLSLEALAKHGGLSGPYKDGWGIGFYEDQDVQVIREPSPASKSNWVRFIEENDLRSRMVISHIRRASAGEPLLENTHPFGRELGGRMHLFAHNGNLKDIRSAKALSSGLHRPVGATDSEYAFCILLSRLQHLWLASDEPPQLHERFKVVRDFAAEMRPLGPANFLYADGDALFAHGHKRRHSDDTVRSPGLCFLRRHCPAEDPVFRAEGVRVIPEEGQEVMLFASVPLTEEAWGPLAEGEVVVTKDADFVLRAKP